MTDVSCDRIMSLGKFKPNRRHMTENQWAEFARTHAPHGLYLYGSPELRYREAHVDHSVRIYHHDLNERMWPHTWLMIWSNMRPTHIKHVTGGSVIVPEPYDVVMFKNDRWLHKQPEITRWEMRRRWFGRAWFTNTEEMALSYLECPS